MRRIFLLLIALFISAVVLNATIITVNLDGSGDYTTIQEGIDASSNGDTVLVADGAYTGENNKNLTWDGNEKHIVVKSENGADNCIIDCEEDGRGFNFDGTNQDTTDVIDGFTIKNGYEWYYGGGIYCNNASPKIQNNIITDNMAQGLLGDGSGGGIDCCSSSSIIMNNIVENNSVLSTGFPGSPIGGGISIFSGSPIVKDNIIRNNETTATDMASSPEAGGIYIGSSSAIIKNNLIIGNSAYHQGYGSSSGGGIVYFAFSYENCCGIIENNTIVNNFADCGSGIYCRGYVNFKDNIIYYNNHEGISCLADSSIISHNDVYGHEQNYVNCPPGIGDTSWGINVNGAPCDSCYNISGNPLFISGPDGNYYLSQIEAGQAQQSPCVDAGDSNAYYYGLDNYTTRTDLVADTGIVDMGYHYPGGIIVSIDGNILEKPEIYLTNYPNPFRTSTTISFFTAKNTPVLRSPDEIGTKGEKDTKIKFYNIKGQLVKHFAIRTPQSEINEIVWDGKDDYGKQLSNGIYFYSLKIEDRIIDTKKCVILR